MTQPDSAVDLAPTWKRLLAFVIDITLFGLILLPLIQALLNQQENFLGPYLANSTPAWLFIIGFNLYNLHSHGQTIGKKLLKIRVVNHDGSRSNFNKLIFMRYLPLLLVAAIPYIGPIALIAIVVSAYFNHGIALHDRWTNMRVISFGITHG